MKRPPPAKRVRRRNRSNNPFGTPLPRIEAAIGERAITDGRLRVPAAVHCELETYIQEQFNAYVFSKPITARICSLFRELHALPSGQENADAFKKLVAKIFNTVFKAELKFVGFEKTLHGGMKRIDIVYRNTWKVVRLFRNNTCDYIPVECKNYSVDPSNPAIDQLLGRFSDKRGRLGFLVCNKIVNRRRLLLRCQQSAQDQHACIILLDREDLKELLVGRLMGTLFKKPDMVSNLLDKHHERMIFSL